MDTPVPQKPKTMAELLPGLSGILTKDARQAVTVMKQPRSTIVATRTAEKPFRPMTIAEMRADIKGLKGPSPRKNAQQPTSTKKKWNSSVKVKKTISIIQSQQGKNNPVRKVLNFQQPKPRIPLLTATSNPKITINPSTPKFLKPDLKIRKTTVQHLQVDNKVANNLRISGIHHIEATPQLVNKPLATKKTLANKENNPQILSQSKILVTTPKSSLRKRILASRIPDTPLSNESWKSSCDDSFLQNEKNIELTENKTNNTEYHKFEDVVKPSPPASTPFKEYRNVNEFFDDSNNDNSSMACQDNTIMCFDNAPTTKENNRREESVIVSLCDMLNKATVTKSENVSSDLADLLEVEKQTLNNITMIENAITSLKNIKNSELQSLQSVRRLIHEKQKQTLECDTKKIFNTTKDDPIQEKTPIRSEPVAKPCSVIKSCLKSPSYKIPKKMTPSVKKKVHYKSLPNIRNFQVTPEKDMSERALNVYLKMKEQMNFLSTPAKQHTPHMVLDTPTIASHNLQKQLDKLYNES